MAAPPVPPRPFDDYDDYRHRSDSLPPAVPPLPPDFHPDDRLAPHFDDPLVAPRPHKFQPDLPANMARTLDQQAVQGPYRGRSPRPPGFAVPPGTDPRTVSPLPPPVGSDWSPWAGAMPQPAVQQAHQPSSPSAYPPLAPGQRIRHSSISSNYTPQRPLQSSPAPTNVSPSLTAPIPTASNLGAQLPAVQQPTYDPVRKIAWLRDVLSLFERSSEPSPELQRLVNAALPILLQLSERDPPMAEALYLLATCESSGAHGQFVPHNPRSAFRHFEQAAKGGFYAAWFRLGRDYETFGDAAHAKQCFERGAKLGDESCLYRMGMAHLMGQLGLPANYDAALPLLHRAATLASVESPQPAYVFGLLLLGEFTHIQLQPALFAPYVPTGSTPGAEARRHLERAAFLNFAPAQYKLGHAYEFAQPPFPFDALLSVQYYSLASQQGEIEADMALSKWFLCGAEGAFDKDEGLAWTFAEKAARKGLPSAEFAMGYYAEVGVGGSKDIDTALKWYTKASEDGNTDATDRLKALSQPSPQALSRAEHDNLTDSTLVRKRTQAKQRSDARPGAPRANGQNPQSLNHVRKSSLMSARLAAGSAAVAGAGAAYAAANTVGAGARAGTGVVAGAAAYGAPTQGSSPSMGGMRLPAVNEQQPMRGRPIASGPNGPNAASSSPHHSVMPYQPSQPSAAAIPPGVQNSYQPSRSPANASPIPSPVPYQPANPNIVPNVHPLSPAGGQRPFANAPRYSLVDPGSSSASETSPSPRLGLPSSPVPRPQRQNQNMAGVGAATRPGPSGSPAGDEPEPKLAPPPRQTTKGPQTFEEMGFTSHKLEDKECRIM
ncbi:hypothetical protein SCP_0507760 [Sparassis crispa]|uniref:HCP-like protein n=1 Tax=Sparassis crispa TaxID=139825 RepID=A0A401GNG8_9APHY|nr:hypothetical protein SCP_0507760 [Sparassis crispa]GBE83720.1 hypothetical protein SCP_0507760 [Sparassis crispa]